MICVFLRIPVDSYDDDEVTIRMNFMDALELDKWKSNNPKLVDLMVDEGVL